MAIDSIEERVRTCGDGRNGRIASTPASPVKARCVAAAALLMFLLLSGNGGVALAVDGSFDPTWAGAGRITFAVDPSHESYAQQLIVESNGNLLIGGYLRFYQWWLAELLPGGVPSSSFGRNDGSGQITSCNLTTNMCGDTDNSFLAMRLQADGRIGVLGVEYLTRTKAQAHSLDTAGVVGGSGSVLPGNLTFNNANGALVTLADLMQTTSGKWLVAGTGIHQSADSDLDLAVIRLNADFSLDTTFNMTTDAENVTFAGGQVVPFDLYSNGDDDANGIVLKADGRIVLVGSAQNSVLNGIPVATRLNADGTFDASYASGTGKSIFGWSSGALHVDLGPNSSKIDRAGRLLVTISATATGQTTSGIAIARLTAGDSGLYDASFGAGGIAFIQPGFCEQAAQPHALALDSAGRILVAGECTHADNTSEFLVARLRGDSGALDTSFGINGISHGTFDAASSVDYATDIAFAPGGKPVLVGLTDGSSTLRAGVARLTYDLIYTNDFEFAPRGCLPPDCN